MDRHDMLSCCSYEMGQWEGDRWAGTAGGTGGQCCLGATGDVGDSDRASPLLSLCLSSFLPHLSSHLILLLILTIQPQKPPPPSHLLTISQLPLYGHASPGL